MRSVGTGNRSARALLVFAPEGPRMLLPLLSLLLGCGRHHAPGCETEVIEVDDDEADLGDLDFTAADVLADLTGRRTLPGRLTDGTIVTGELDIVRDEGVAIFRDATPQDIVTVQPGLGESWQLNYVHCEDALEIPLDLSFVAEDAPLTMDVGMLATAGPPGDPSDPVRYVDVDSSAERPSGTLGARLYFADDRVAYAEIDGPDNVFSFPPETHE